MNTEHMCDVPNQSTNVLKTSMSLLVVVSLLAGDDM